MSHRAIHLMLDSLAAGIVLATASVVGMLWFDVMEIGRLSRTVDGGSLAVWILWIGLLSAFTPAAMAIAFALSPDGEDKGARRR
jgi:hypothetical protein